MTAYLRLKQVAEALGMSERTIYRLVVDGELHGVKTGKAWLFTQADIDGYIEQREQATQQKIAEKKAKREEV